MQLHISNNMGNTVKVNIQTFRVVTLTSDRAMSLYLLVELVNRPVNHFLRVNPSVVIFSLTFQEDTLQIVESTIIGSFSY